MGKLEMVATSRIRPSQDYLKQDTLKFILPCIENKDFESLPSAPIVRKDPGSDLYIAIDGHNLIAVYDLMHKDIEVYIAESAQDLMKETSPSVNSRNNDLAQKYESALSQTRSLKKQGFDSFTKLRNKYPILADS